MAGERILIASTKYDGSLHYEYGATFEGQSDGILRCTVEAGEPWIGYRGEGAIQRTFTALFFTNRWFNVFHNHEPMGNRGILSYANVATPIEFDGETVRWTDLDIDIVVSERFGVTVDDEDEFEEHQDRFEYPTDIVERVLQTRDELLELARSSDFPLDRSTHVPD
jgi:protein associated with RNAse G/E